MFRGETNRALTHHNGVSPLVKRGALCGLLADHRRPPLRSHKDFVLRPL